MTEFAGIQDQKLDAPNPNAAPYVDPNQWWYDMTPQQQEAYREESVAFIRNVGAVVGVSAVTSNSGWVTQDNPRGINPEVWAEYKRVTAVPLAEKPIEALKADLTVVKDQARIIEKAIAGFAGVQG